MKKNILWKLKMYSIYSFLVLLIQGVLLNVLFASSPIVGQSLNIIKVSINLEKVTLYEALKKIEDNTDFKFTYNKKEIPLEEEVSIYVNEGTLYQVLEELSRSLGLIFRRVNNQIVVKKIEKNSIITETLNKEHGTIKGKVIDKKTGEPLFGVNILVEGTTIGGTSDFEGNFRIKKIPVGNGRLKVSYIGYKDKLIDYVVYADKISEIDIELEATMVDLDEVVVTGSLSDRKKRAVANPITTISPVELKNMPISNIGELFEGKIPGGYSMGTYETRSALQLSIRGGQKFHSLFNGVKIYIDGAETASSSSAMTDIPPENIEKIDILRGPMASTLYGSGASGGVIQIFTKKGSREGTKINFKSEFTATPTKYLTNTPFSQNYSLGLTGGASIFDYNLGLSRAVSDQLLPGNGIKDDSWNLNVGGRMTSKSFSFELKASIGSFIEGTTSNPYIKEFAKERGWVKWKPNKFNQEREYKDKRTTLNLRHFITDNWYHKLTLGYNNSSSTLKDQEPVEYVEINFETFETKKYYLYSFGNYNLSKITMQWFTNYKKDLSSIFNIDVTAGFEIIDNTSNNVRAKFKRKPENMDLVTPHSSEFTENGYQNYGYFGETVVAFNNVLFLTAGMRLEDNSSYGDKYGIDKNPRIGLTYVKDWGNIKIKPRVSWGSSTQAPDESQKLRQENSYSVTLANPNLGPENQSGYEVGADLYFGNNLFLEVTYYNQKVKNGINIVDAGKETGTNRLLMKWQNVNTFFNKGWEFAGKLNANPFIFNFTFSIDDSKYGAGGDPDRYEFREGARRLYTPYQTGSFCIGYNVPAFFSNSRKGGYIGLDLTYTGKSLVPNDLRKNDGLYNPNIKKLDPKDPANWIKKDAFVKLRLRANYWIRNNISMFFEVRNLTDYQKGGYSMVYPSIGRQYKFGFNLELK